MNILPLIFTFLLVFSCIALTLIKDVKSHALMEASLKGHYRAERAVNNAIVRRAYNKIKVKPPEGKKDPQNQTNKKYHSLRRVLSPPLEQSKFNLDPLIQGDQGWQQHPLYEPMAELLRLLYGKILFKKEKDPEKLPYLLIDEMVKKARKTPKLQHLSQLFPNDPDLKKVYYKMLKGTNQYDSNQGIPPLGNFFCIGRGDKAVLFSFASPLLLEALFGSKISLEILKLEQEKSTNSNNNYYSPKEDLQNLCMSNTNKTSILTLLEPYLDYSKKNEPHNQIGGKDLITGIIVEKSL